MLETSVYLHVDKRKLNRMPQAVKERLAQVVLNTALAGRDAAQEEVYKDTGATAAGIHVMHRNHDGYDEAIAEVNARDPKRQVFASEGAPQDILVADVVCATTNAWIEDHRRPFFNAAILNQYENFGKDVAQAVQEGCRDA